jgi:hypothetical protein
MTGETVLDGGNGHIREDIAMSQSITIQGSSYTEDDLRETIWLVTQELRAGLPKRERIAAQRQIAALEAALTRLSNAADAGP